MGIAVGGEEMFIRAVLLLFCTCYLGLCHHVSCSMVFCQGVVCRLAESALPEKIIFSRNLNEHCLRDLSPVVP